MGEGSTDRGSRWAAALLGLAGVVVLGWSYLLATFSCFMVSDPACGPAATSNAVPVALLGVILIVVALWIGIRGGRRGDPGTRPGP